MEATSACSAPTETDAVGGSWSGGGGGAESWRCWSGGGSCAGNLTSVGRHDMAPTEPGRSMFWSTVVGSVGNGNVAVDAAGSSPTESGGADDRRNIAGAGPGA